MSKLSKLEKLEQPFTVGQAQSVGVSQSMLAYLCRSEQIKRVAHGLYALPDHTSLTLEQELIELQKIYPTSIVGHTSALALYGLTENLSDSHVLVVANDNFPTRRTDGVELVRTRNFTEIESVKFKGVKVTSIDQTIVDLLRTNQPLSLAIEVFQSAKQNKKKNKGQVPSFSGLKRIAKKFRAATKTQQLIDAVL